MLAGAAGAGDSSVLVTVPPEQPAASVATAASAMESVRTFTYAPTSWSGSTGSRDRISDLMSSSPSQMLTFIPASTRFSRVEPERRELAAGHIAAGHHAVVVGCVPDVLHAEVVLVGEEIGQFGVLLRLAEHPRDRDGRLLERIRPMLGANPGAEEWMLGRGDIADREDVRVAGA